jgi:hypothetical protein
MALGRKRTSRDARFPRLADRHHPRPADGSRLDDDTVSRLCRYYLDCLTLEHTELADRPERSGTGAPD